MEVWVLEWSYPYDNEHNVSLWTTQSEAQEQGLKEIIDVIANDFDMDDVNAASCADDIDDMMRRGDRSGALDRWNTFQDEYRDDQAQYYYVSKKQVLGAGAKASSNGSAAFIATSNGATCRGPCKQHNEYANADQADGTYICRQCSTFQHIFGTKP